MERRNVLEAAMLIIPSSSTLKVTHHMMHE